MTTPRFLSATSGFVPEQTGLVISYLRNPAEFAINSYCQYVESDAIVGLYSRLSKDQPARVVVDADYEWADGADSPSGNSNLMTWELAEFTCKRRAFPFEVGNMAVQQTKKSWDVLAVHTKMATQQAMTLRTNRVISMLETASGWGTHVASANDLNGGAGTWDTASDDPASPNYNAIRKSLLQAANVIALDTNSNVQMKDLQLVLSPGLAIRMANTGEIHNFLKYGNYSKAARDGRDTGKWGLPPEYAGFQIVVEDCVRVSDRPTAAGTAGTRAYVKSDNSALLTSRKGGIDGNIGTKTWSTFNLFWHKWQMAVQVEEDRWNEKTKGKCIEMYAEILAAPETGFLIQNVLP